MPAPRGVELEHHVLPFLLHYRFEVVRRQLSNESRKRGEDGGTEGVWQHRQPGRKKVNRGPRAVCTTFARLLLFIMMYARYFGGEEESISECTDGVSTRRSHGTVGASVRVLSADKKQPLRCALRRILERDRDGEARKLLTTSTRVRNRQFARPGSSNQGKT